MVTCVAISADNKKVIASSRSKITMMWDASTGKRIRRIESDGNFSAMAFAPDGASVLMIAEGGFLRLLELTTAEDRSEKFEDFFEQYKEQMRLNSRRKLYID